MTYRAPIAEQRFLLRHVVRIDELAGDARFAEATPDLVDAILEGAAQFAEGEFAPLDRIGDEVGARWSPEGVTMPAGFREAYRAYVEGGWGTIGAPGEFGGQGLPFVLSSAVLETLGAANMGFALAPTLTVGAIEALFHHGTPEQQAAYLPHLATGAWTGTMNLTEPQAGSDLAMVRTRAVPQGDGTYKIFGTKIFITYGDHDMASNILHLVLARVAGAPEGVKGISLFLVPKFLVAEDGSLGARNDVQCVSLEHKMGIRASPTAVLAFGAGEGALGELIGEENRGLEYMFIMMNAARYAVGMQGIGVAERARQQAVAYAKERVQSRPVDGSQAGSATIVHHPDVKRMLMLQRALTEGCRAMALCAAADFDAAHAHPDEAVRRQKQAAYEFMVPLVKGYSTEMSLEATSLNVQVHGGMGFIEETGAAQHCRDARILTIYEGTTAIQANDLVGRKTARDGGQAARAVAAQVIATEEALRADASEAALAMLGPLSAAREAFEAVVAFVVDQARSNPNAVYAGSVPYLMLAGNLVAGWQMARALLAAQSQVAAGQGDTPFLQAKVATARFYAEHILTRVPGQRAAILNGAASVCALSPDDF